MKAPDKDDRSAAAAAGAERQSFRSTFRCEGEYWTISFDGVTSRLRDSAGVRHIAALLSRPRERIPATVLAGSGKGNGIGPATTEALSPLDAALALERARVNVTRAIGATLRRLTLHHPTLAQHLQSTLRTGTFCSYTPDSRLPITWEV